MIKEIGINNFKCFSNTNLRLNNLTVLAGINSVGKSTVIQSLLLIRQTLDKLKMHSLTHLENLKVLLNNEYCLQLGNSTEVLNKDAESEKIVFVLTGDNGNEVQFNFIASRDYPELYLSFPYDKLILNENIDNMPIYAKQFHYLNTERIGPRVVQDMVNQEFPNTGYRGEYTGYSIAGERSELKVEERKRIKSSVLTVPNLNKQVEYWLDFVIPGMEFKPDSYEKMNIVGIGLQRKLSGTGFLNPNNIGFGVSYALPIIASGLLAEEGCMLIVENPEVHLHPSGQSRIGQFLAQVASAGVQVIIETHSEHIINGIRIAALKDIITTDRIAINYFNLEEDLKNIIIEYITLNEYVELSKWPKGFLDQEQQDLREMVQLRKGLKK